jgi:hypothetical protein
MSLESDGGMIYSQGKTEKLGEKPVPVPLYPPQIPRGLTRTNPGLRGERLATSRLSHGTAHILLLARQILLTTTYNVPPNNGYKTETTLSSERAYRIPLAGPLNGKGQVVHCRCQRSDRGLVEFPSFIGYLDSCVTGMSCPSLPIQPARSVKIKYTKLSREIFFILKDAARCDVMPRLLLYVQVPHMLLTLKPCCRMDVVQTKTVSNTNYFRYKFKIIF